MLFWLVSGGWGGGGGGLCDKPKGVSEGGFYVEGQHFIQLVSQQSLDSSCMSFEEITQCNMPVVMDIFERVTYPSHYSKQN